MAGEPAPPANAAEARTQLAALQSDEAWLTNFNSGNGPETTKAAELQRVIAGDKNAVIDNAMAGVVPMNGVFLDSEARLMAEHADYLRQNGVPDDAIRQSISGGAVTQAEYDAATRTKAALMADHDWVTKYNAGNGPHKSQMSLLNIILTSKIKETA